MLQEEEDASIVPHIRFINQQGTLPKKATITLESKVEDRLEQRMTGSEQLRGGAALNPKQGLVERDAFVSGKHPSASAYPVSLTNTFRDSRDFETKMLTFNHAAT
jgi:hypothetical protein